jgi:hypothetical protein
MNGGIRFAIPPYALLNSKSDERQRIFGVTHALAPPAAGGPRKISGALRKSSVFSVACESAGRNFICS